MDDKRGLDGGVGEGQTLVLYPRQTPVGRRPTAGGRKGGGTGGGPVRSHASMDACEKSQYLGTRLSSREEKLGSQVP